MRKAVQTRVHIRRFDVDARTPPVPAARPACRPETLRGTSDLTFDFVASGTGIDENGEQYANGHWRHHLSRSDWIEQLRNVGPREILLLEVPIPLEGTADGWRAIATGLQRAEEQYHSGDYHSCVGSCRTVLEELGIYTHLAQDGPSEGGVTAYTRAEAQFVISLTAAAAAHAQPG